MRAKSKLIALCPALILALTACGNKTADSGSSAVSAVGSTVGEPNSADFVSSTNESSTFVSSEESSNNTGLANSSPISGTDIGLETAKTAALKHAGIAEADASFTEAKLEYDDGRAEYDIKFTANAKRYEYEISPRTARCWGSRPRKFRTRRA